MLQQQVPIRQAVADAVELVNANAGSATVHLHFRGEPGFDFIANSARFAGDDFEFSCGFETFSGSVAEIDDIRAEVIH
ncbi:MAG: hypothetical protein AB7N71_13015 [Phycisphaerae bacterium]